MTINLPLKWEISTRAVTLLWDPFCRSNYRQISLKLLFVYKLSYKKFKSVKHRVIGSIFRGQQLIKDGLKDLRTPDMNRVKWVRQQLRMVMVWVLSFVIIIAQSDTINRIFNCLAKENKFGAATFWVA